MGAADTYIAKPWRREVYVQAAGYPHPVLGHELMHVLAGVLRARAVPRRRERAAGCCRIPASSRAWRSPPRRARAISRRASGPRR